MRRQGVYLRDTGHVSNYRRADAASTADKVAVFKRVLDKLLRAHVDNIVAVVKYCVQFGVNTLLHKFRRIIAVN